MTPTIELRTVPTRPAIVVHTRCATNAIGATLGSVFGEVAGWAGAHHVALAGPALARYAVIDGKECELDAGFVVSGAPAGDDRVRAIDLGDCTAACATHLGSYESLAETYAAMERWIGEHGYVSAGPMWEEYFSPPDTPPDRTRTDVYWPVRKG